MKTSYRALLVAALAGSIITVAVSSIVNTLQRDNARGILATVNNHKLTQKDLNDTTLGKLQELKNARYKILNTETELWIKKTVATLEAKKRSQTYEEFMKENILSKNNIQDSDIYAVYTQCPDAWDEDYKTAINNIAHYLNNTNLKQIRNNFFNSIYPNYRIRRFLQQPESYSESPDKMIIPYKKHVITKAMNDTKNGQVINPPYRGPKDAKAVMVVYSDFMCPFSARFSQTYDQLRSAFPDHFRIEYRHLPLPFHKGADLMAQASICAQEQKQFWPYHDMLFEDPKRNNKEALLQIAKDLGLDVSAFKSCTESKKYTEFLNKDIQSAKDLKINGTPTFFLNGKRFSGALGYKSLKNSVGWLINPSGAFPNPQPQNNKNTAQNQVKHAATDTPVKFSDKDLNNSPSIGPDDARVTIVLFVDFNCTFSRKIYKTLNSLMKKYPGDIRLIHKQFPLQSHPEAESIASYGLCLNNQNKYWNFRDEVFGDSWPVRSNQDLSKIVKNMDIDQADLLTCVNNNSCADQIAGDIKLGKSINVTGTPTMFINGQRVFGAKPMEDIESIILQEVKKPRS